MIGWYRTQIREFGVVAATRLFGRVAWARSNAGLQNRLLPKRLTCPCCGWQGRRFNDYIELGYALPNAVCPQCGSQPRHRAFQLWLQQTYRLKDRHGRALVFAPEQVLAPLWATAEKLRVVRVDIAPGPGVDLLADLTRLPLAPDSIDLIWCHHVLEHIEHDRVAISELCRVLRPQTGELIVSVPMELGTKTREFGFADPRQTYHWRMYGDDFADRLAEAGFTVETHTHHLPPAEMQRYGIWPERFYVCRKERAQRAGNAAPTSNEA